MRKDSYHHENLREELIRSGLKLLDEEGYGGFSLRKAARACGVTQTAAYRHFANKDDLMAAIALEIAGKFDECLRAASEKYEGEPEKQLREIGCAYVEFFVRNPEYLRIMFLSDVFRRVFGDMHLPPLAQAGGSPSPGSDFSAQRSFKTFYEAVLRYKDSEGAKKYEKLSVEEMALYLWGLVQGMAVLLSRNEFPLSGDPMQHVRKLLYFGEIL